MKKYKIYFTYHFVAGDTFTLVGDYKYDNIDTEFISKLIDSMLEVPYNSQIRNGSSTTINMRNVTYIEIDVKEIENEEENKTNS